MKQENMCFININFKVSHKKNPFHFFPLVPICFPVPGLKQKIVSWFHSATVKAQALCDHRSVRAGRVVHTTDPIQAIVCSTHPSCTDGRAHGELRVSRNLGLASSPAPRPAPAPRLRRRRDEGAYIILYYLQRHGKQLAFRLSPMPETKEQERAPP
jgi:hypothetical protein